MSSAPPQKPKPSLLALLIPLAIWIVFGIVAVAVAVVSISRADTIVDDFARVEPDTETTVALRSTGGYRIWLERDGVSDEVGDPDTTVTVTRDGEPISVERYATDLDYAFGGREGTAIYTFDAPAEGEYVVSGQINDGGGGQFAVGKANPVGEAAKGILFMILIGTAGFLIFLVLGIILLVRRGRSKRRIRQSYPPAGYPQHAHGQQQGGGQPGDGQWPGFGQAPGEGQAQGYSAPTPGSPPPSGSPPTPGPPPGSGPTPGPPPPQS